MKFPEFLYAPSASEIDRAIVLPQRVAQFNLNSAASTQLRVAFGPVPRDKIFILVNASGISNPNAADQIAPAGSQLQIEAQDASGSFIEIANLKRALGFPALGADVSQVIQWDGEALLMPGEYVRYQGTFTGITAANLVALAIVGYLLPRANLQHVQLETTIL